MIRLLPPPRPAILGGWIKGVGRLIGFLLWLTESAEGTTLLAAAAILIRRRHRSRRATGLALVAVLCLAGDWLFGVVLMATWN